MTQSHHHQYYASSFITIIFLISFASSQDTLRQGETLNTTSLLVSAGRIFTLGFYTPDRANTSYLAIWFTDPVSGSFNLPVWIGNRDNPVSNNSFPNLTISSTGDLLISNGTRENPINLYAGTESRQNVSAILLDTGNFVLRSGEVILWESFDYPTDTLLPGMKLGVNHRTGRTWSLTSWFRTRDTTSYHPSDPATGPFTLDWDTALDTLIIRRRGVVYWTSGNVDSGSGSLRVYGFENMDAPDPFNSNYNFTHFTSNEEEYFMYSLLRVPNMTPDSRTVISGWRLGYQGDINDGVNGDIPAVAMASLCYGYNTGGSGISRGCELWDQPSCGTPRLNFSLRTGDFRTLGLNFSSDENSSLSFSDCWQKCWNDCECRGFRSREPGCQYWKGRNLRFVQSNDGSSNRIYVLMSASSNNRSRTLLWIIIAVVVATLLLLSVAVLVFLRISKRRKREKEYNELLTLDGYTDDLRKFAYPSIVAATDNFSSKYKLGEGGFGSVYKGQTPEGHEIAVKMLSRSSGQGLLEFKTELVLISKLQHVNLVKLVGFCVHGEDKMIVYDYMPNKSLDFYLFDLTKREELDWGRRFNIIEGIAQGLLYLHKYSRLNIVHRDLKCSNILLDDNLNPKISDFGLARIFKQNIDEANTNRRVGTYGYMAPEYAMQGIFSYKSDVYSFGVLVLEIVSGRKNSSFHHVEGPLNLVEYAWELWSKDSALELMDPTLSNSCNVEQLQRCINIGLLCVENRATDRPNIEDVISMLRNETSLRLPKNPSFFTRNMVLEELGKNSSNKFSGNELSISEIGGR